MKRTTELAAAYDARIKPAIRIVVTELPSLQDSSQETPPKPGARKRKKKVRTI